MSEERTRPTPSHRTGSRSLIQLIATDIHFWIPLAVLVAGLLLLDKLS